MLLAVVFLIIGFAFVIYLKWEYSSYVKTIDLLPGPKKLPLVGSILSVPRDPHGNKYRFKNYIQSSRQFFT